MYVPPTTPEIDIYRYIFPIKHNFRQNPMIIIKGIPLETLQTL